MKRFLVLAVMVFFINACDDGDVSIQNINFDDAPIDVCGEFIYKLNTNEALVLRIPTTDGAFLNDETPVNVPRIRQIGGPIKVYYRSYNGNVSANNICILPTPINPTVTEEWNAISGTIEITTTSIKSTDATTLATKITGYNHKIVFRDITYQKPDGILVIGDPKTFGNITTTATVLPFAFTSDLNKCTSGLVNKQIGSEGITLNIAPLLINNTLTTPTSPKTGLITATTNKLTYKLFNGLLPNNYYCLSPIPTAPQVVQEWVGNNGISGTSGIIDVYTTTNGTGFKHTIHLRNAILKNGNSNFTLGTDYILGELLTN